MAADIVTIANRIVAELNDQLPGWGYSANAVRRNTPTYSLDELSKTRFTVIPMSRQTLIASKGSPRLIDTRPRVDIDIRYRTGNDQTTNDRLMLASELIAEHFLGGVEGLDSCLEAETSVVFQTDEMIKDGVFVTAVSLTFHVMRSAR